MLALWSAKGQSLTAAEVAALVSRLDAKPKTVAAAQLLLPAAVLGDGRVKTKTAVHASSDAEKVLKSTAKKPKAAVTEALRRARVVPLDSLSGVLAVLGPLTKSAADMRGAASYAVHLSANEATVSAAAQVEAKVVFVPERDACLECTEMAGATGDDIELPPLHPHCRCEVQPYDDEDVPKALKREAVRSVLRGFSLPSESEAARLRRRSVEEGSGRAGLGEAVRG